MLHHKPKCKAIIKFLILVQIALLTTRCGESVASPTLYDDPPDRRPAWLDKVGEPSPFQAARLPNRLSSADLSWLRKMANPADEQWKSWQQLYDAYTTCWIQIWDKRTEGLLATSKGLNESGLAGDMSSSLAFSEAWHALAKGAVDDWQRCEGAMLQSLEGSVAGEEQLRAVQRLRLKRDRDAGMIAMSLAGAANVDLVTIVEVATKRDRGHEGIDAILWEYEQRVSPLFAKRYIGLHDRILKDSQWSAEVAFGHQSKGDERYTPEVLQKSAEIDAERKRLWASIFRINKEIIDVNADFAIRIAEQLAEQDRGRFVKEFRARSWQNVYPDRSSIEDIFDETLALPGLDDALKDAIAGLRHRHMQDYETICNNMIGRVLKWMEELGENSVYNSFQQAAYHKDMRAMNTRREELNRSNLDILMALFQGTISEKLDEMIEHRAQQLEYGKRFGGYQPNVGG